MTAITFDDVRVEYRTRRGRFQALDGLDLEVPRGGVFGFLGPNGAGKTTAIRAALGLCRSQSGRIRMLDADVPRRLGRCIDRVGALVEQPSFFPHFSGRRNLELLARSRGFGAARVSDALERTGMTERADSLVAGYSLGMRQRLGIAAVLLKDPELLVLDEPANGLDPAGIIHIRTLMRTLAREGRTVFVSSHLLSEIELSCDRVAIMDRGRCVTTGTVDELAGTGSQFRVQCNDPRAVQVLAAAGFRTRAESEGSLVVDANGAPAEAITRALADAGIYPSGLAPVGRSLEHLFLQCTGLPSGEPAAQPTGRIAGQLTEVSS